MHWWTDGEAWYMLNYGANLIIFLSACLMLSFVLPPRVLMRAARAHTHTTQQPNLDQLVFTHSQPCQTFGPSHEPQLCSSLMICKTLCAGQTPMKTLSFRCFQIVQASNVIKEFTPVCNDPATKVMVLDHHSKECIVDGWVGVIDQGDQHVKQDWPGLLLKDTRD